jgi:hypothetical protein
MVIKELISFDGVAGAGTHGVLCMKASATERWPLPGSFVGQSVLSRILNGAVIVYCPSEA